MFVAQPEIKPGCVLRRSNISVLENKKLVSGNEVCAAAGSLWCTPCSPLAVLGAGPNWLVMQALQPCSFICTT